MQGESMRERVAKNSKETAGVPVLSFFTGAGFLDIGCMQAGMRIIWHNELDASFRRGFMRGMDGYCKGKLNIRSPNKNSIAEIGPNQIMSEAFEGLPRPRVFGAIGGPPCPDFSVGGKNRGADGCNGRLSGIYVNRLLEILPSFFILENVPGLFRTAKHRVFFEELRLRLSTEYITSCKILNALEYGVPQDRERVFLIGFHSKWIRKQFGSSFLKAVRKGDADWFPWPEKLYPDAKIRFSWPRQSPFGSDPPRPDGIPSELMVGPLILNSERLRSLPNGNEGFRPKSNKFHEIPEGDDSRKSFKRLHRWRYSPAAAYGNNEVHLHPTKPRRLTVREAMLIQTVPDSYVLPSDMPLSHKFKMIGNGVPVKLADYVASAVMRVLRGETNARVL